MTNAFSLFGGGPTGRAAVALIALTSAGFCAEANRDLIPLEGETLIHDPSTILQHHERYFAFGTGRGIISKSSIDLVHWTNGPPVFQTPPGWTTNLVPGYRGHTWAPDVIRLNGRYHLYFSVSTFGKQVSAIGLATNPTLDPSSPDYHWTDRGPILESTNGSPYNAIDPGVTLDANGTLWMVYGSFWKGIYLVPLDSNTGLRLDSNPAPRRLAWSPAIEAPCLMRHGEFYYLFVNWGRCCRGTNSTYEVRVGRSQTITGPYFDREGVNLVDGGGLLFLESTGPFIGPGHIGILPDGARFSYHYYDARSNGRPRLALGRLHWTRDGWPAATDAMTPPKKSDL